MRIIFFGTPEIAALILRLLHEKGVNIITAVSKPDKPKGRSSALQPTAVKEEALRLGIPILQPEKASSPEFVDSLKLLDPDLLVVVAYGEIVKQNVLDLPRIGCINLHASLLPEYRGAAPMQRALIDGCSQTGVTIMHMVKKLDAGDIIRQSPIAIPLTMTLEELKDRVIEEGGRLLLDVLADFEKGVVKNIPQDESKVTFAPKVTPEEMRLDFNQPVLKLHNLIRGISPKPGAYFLARVRGQETMIKVYRSFPFLQNSEKPGSLIIKNKKIFITCQDGLLELIEVQSAGRKRMSASAWSSGLPPEGIDILTS